MAYENGPRSLIDDDRDILVYIPEAAEPDAERIVVVDRPLPARTRGSSGTRPCGSSWASPWP